MLYILTFAISLILSLVLTPIVRKVMLKLRILDQPSESRWHRQPVALMGGIAIFVSFMIAAFVSINLPLDCRLSIVDCRLGSLFNQQSSIINHQSNGADRFRIYIILMGACAIFILGVLDDLKGTHPKSKFASQAFIAFLMILFGIKSKIFPYIWLNIPLTLIWIVGLTNALNFIDNMDGLSSGVAFIAAITIFGMSLQRVGEVSATSPTIALLALGLAGSCLGFLFFNFKPAKIFMGDCGSMFLGFTLATISICAGWQHSSNPTSTKSLSAATLLAPIIALSVPIFDITLVTLLRLKNGRMPWHGGKDHSSHRLVAILRGSEKGAVLILYAISILSGVLALVVLRNNSFFALIATGLLAIGMIGFGIKLAKVPYNYRSPT